MFSVLKNVIPDLIPESYARKILDCGNPADIQNFDTCYSFKNINFFTYRYIYDEACKNRGTGG